MKYHILSSVQDMEVLDFMPTMIICFYRVEKSEIFRSYYLSLKNRFSSADIIGCSSESNVHNQLPYIDYDDIHTCTFLCLEMKKEAYTVEVFSQSKKEKFSLNDNKQYKAIVLSACYSQYLTEFIEEVEDKIGVCTVWGAIAGTDLTHVNAGSVFYNGKFIEDGILVWLIDQSKYTLDGVCVHNFDTVVFELEITKTNENIIYEIENKPALTMVEALIGTLEAESIVSFDHPFFIRQKIHKNIEEVPLSSVLSIDREEGSITLFNQVHRGDKLKLAVPYRREEQESQLESFSKYAVDDGVALLFLCVAYKRHWGDMQPIYLMHFAKHLNMPFMGLHTNGKIGSLNTKDRTFIQNQTLTLAVLSEKRGV